MAQQNQLSLSMQMLICVQFFFWISVSQIEANAVPMTQNELRDKYGQGIFWKLLKKAH